MMERQLTMVCAEEQAEIDHIVAERRCTRDQAAQFLRKGPAVPGPVPERALKPLPERD